MSTDLTKTETWDNRVARLTDTAAALDLDELEEAIGDHLDSFASVGVALAEIRDRQLFKPAYRSFDAYCLERWGFTSRTANRQIKTAETNAALPPGSPRKSQREVARGPERSGARVPVVNGAEPEARGGLLSDQLSAAVALRDAIRVAVPSWTAKSATDEFGKELDTWCYEYLVARGLAPAPDVRGSGPARGVAVGNASSMMTNVTHSNDVSLRLPGDTKPATKRRALAAVDAAESAPAACSHPPKGRYRGTSGVTMCKACGKVAR